MRESGASPFGDAQPRGASSGILKHTPGKTLPVSCPATQPSMGGARVAGWFGGENGQCGNCVVPEQGLWVVRCAEGFGLDSSGGKMGWM